jgi:hypothetical protein
MAVALLVYLVVQVLPSIFPVKYFRLEVIPAINLHAATVMINWKPVTLLEYLTWIASLAIMSTNWIPDKSAYWHKSAFAFGPSMDFSMSTKRIKAL